MTAVSSRLHHRIVRDFPQAGSAEEVVRLLADASGSERVQAAIVLAARGDLAELRREVELAAVDWRDVLVNGGLAGDDWQSVLTSTLGPDQTS
ncbi:hypothetical protein [Terrabacter sp. Ter38]|uniref:hypothetical protein n=1 Tax=Terrabacter sp. Ter38 TaxID=2926030 RepID=UPI0021196B7E|nr:hypothetical protein [Terrabacter sp. Ter38]